MNLNSGFYLHRLRGLVGDDRLLGEAAVSAGFITPEQFSECEEKWSASAGPSFREILERHCRLAPQTLDVLEKVARSDSAGMNALGGRYQLQGELGRGGSGIVYRTWDLQLKRKVAVKLLRSDVALSPVLIQRLRQEALAIARLDHPNLVRLHDVGELGGLPYLVLQLVEGRDLAEVFASKDLSVRKLVDILEKVARAMHHAHRSGVVHRDLKPGNIVVDSGGEPHVLDFGLAHLYGAEDGLTRTGAVIGTPVYMAPEQVRGEKNKVDARTDVYALGAILYEALTGRPAFEAETLAGVYQKVLHEEPRAPRIVQPAVHPELEIIALKAIDKEPHRRYGTAEALADDLRRHLNGEPILARPPTWLTLVKRKARRHRAIAAFAGALALSVVALVAAGLGQALVRRTKLGRARSDARALMRTEEWDRAAARWAEAQVLDPRDAEIQIQRRISEYLGKSVRALRRRDDLLREQQALPVTRWKPDDTEEENLRRWSTEDSRESLKQETSRCEKEAEESALAAAALDAEMIAPRRILGDLYYRRYEDARRSKSPMTEAWKNQALAYGGERVREMIESCCAVSLKTIPEGATAYLFRFEDRRHRMLPLPCNSRGEVREPVRICPIQPLARDASDEEERKAREGTAYPLETDEYNLVSFPVRLPPGSYAVLLRKDGWADTRCLLWLNDPSVSLEAEASLASKDAPPGFVPVPGGPFQAGDMSAVDFSSRRTTGKIDLPEFWIARYSVTREEYREFLKEQPPDAVRGFLPIPTRWGKRVGREWNGEDPIEGISWYAAQAFAEWYTRKRGAGEWKFSLPTAEQWEKAARGVDGRRFPWGDLLDPPFAATVESCDPRGRTTGEPRGLFVADESPYGVRDMAGVVMNWTRTEVRTSLRIIKGGAATSSAIFSRCGSRADMDAGDRREGLGFRLVAERIR